MQYIGSGRVREVGGGGGWVDKGGLYHPLEQALNCCVLNKAQKQPQSVHWAKTVIGTLVYTLQ